MTLTMIFKGFGPWRQLAQNHKGRMTHADQQFLKKYSQNYIIHLNNRLYCARFPWKEDHPPLSSNYNTCWQKTCSLTHHLAQTPNLLQLYDGVTP